MFNFLKLLRQNQLIDKFSQRLVEIIESQNNFSEVYIEKMNTVELWKNLKTVNPKMFQVLSNVVNEKVIVTAQPVKDDESSQNVVVCEPIGEITASSVLRT